MMLQRYYLLILLLLAAVTAVTGCGTTRATDTGRTATEQLLISDAVDQAVQTVNFGTLAGQSVFLDDKRVAEVVDRNYLISALRQHLLASGCQLRDKAEEADYVVEIRAGAIGTDRNDLLFGVPSMNVPQIMPLQPTPSAIPEIPIAKRRDQRGVAKIAVFAYHRASGTPVWQSGVSQTESSSNDVWILGAGPFQRGTIYDGTEFAGNALRNKTADERASSPRKTIALSNEKVFTPPAQIAAAESVKHADTQVKQASAETPVVAAQTNLNDAKSAALKAGSVQLPSEASQAKDDSSATKQQVPTRPKNEKGLAAQIDDTDRYETKR